MVAHLLRRELRYCDYIQQKINKHMDKYTNADLTRLFLLTHGAGVACVHDVITNSSDYTAPDGEFAYAIELYTDAGKFDELKEDGGGNLSALRRTMDGEGYPQGTVIYGKFTAVKPATGTRVGIYKVKFR